MTLLSVFYVHAVFRRCLPDLTLKELRKIVYVHHSTMKRHRLDLQGGRAKQMLCIGDTLVVNVFRNRLAVLLLEYRGKIYARYVIYNLDKKTLEKMNAELNRKQNA